MHEIQTVFLPRIVVAGAVLERQEDGNYTGQVRRAETVAGVLSAKVSDSKWSHKPDVVPWDVRVGQEWLRQNPGKWTPLEAT